MQKTLLLSLKFIVAVFFFAVFSFAGEAQAALPTGMLQGSMLAIPTGETLPLGTLTLTDDNGEITSANDIIIRLPLWLDVRFEASLNILYFAGPAAGKMSGNVVYSEDRKTATIDVMEDFVPGEVLEIDGFAVCGCGPANSSWGSLEWSVDGGVEFGWWSSAYVKIVSTVDLTNEWFYFKVGETVTIPTLTVTDYVGDLQDGDTIIIRIPEKSSAVFDMNIGAPQFGGTAWDKVNSDIVYNNKELVITVNDGFNANDTITIDGLVMSAEGWATYSVFFDWSYDSGSTFVQSNAMFAVYPGELMYAVLTPETTVAEAAGELVINFGTMNPIPGDGVIEIFLLEKGDQETGFTYVGDGSGVCFNMDGMIVVEAFDPAALRSIRLRRVGGAEARPGMFSCVIPGFKNAPMPAEPWNRFVSITTNTADEWPIDVGSAPLFNLTAPGTIKDASTVVSPAYLGAASDVTVAFTPSMLWWDQGKLQITFPEGFVAGGINNASCTTQGLEEPEAVSVVLAGQTVTFVREGGGMIADTPWSCTFSGLVNPQVAGTTDSFSLALITSADSIVETGEASGVAIVQGPIAPVETGDVPAWKTPAETTPPLENSTTESASNTSSSGTSTGGSTGSGGNVSGVGSTSGGASAGGSGSGTNGGGVSGNTASIATATPAPITLADLTITGKLVKGMGPAVYLVTKEGRYLFPNEATYRSWFRDFSDVVEFDDAVVGATPLVGNMTMRPGTYLVKTPGDARVYAIEPNKKLRWIENEDIAAAIYGSAWDSRVVELAAAAFSDYQFGVDLTSPEYPVGTLLADAHGYALVTAPQYVQIFDGEALAAAGLQTVFSTPTGGGIAFAFGPPITAPVSTIAAIN